MGAKGAESGILGRRAFQKGDGFCSLGRQWG